MREVTTFSDKATRTDGAHLQWRPERNITDGGVRTPHGIVLAWSWPSEGRMGGGFMLCFVWNGRTYWQKGDKSYTARGLTTAAGRFARDVAAGRYDHA